MIVQSARKYADKIALQDLKETPIPKVTCHLLLKNILTFGVALKNLDVKERSHIAIIGDNRVKSGKNVFPEDKEISRTEKLILRRENLNVRDGNFRSSIQCGRLEAISEMFCHLPF
jgi:hypothetical protein